MERYNFTNPLFLLKIESMIRRFFICFLLVFLVACDDGDIITIDLDFERELERCENNEDYYLLYDTRENPNESLVLIIDRSEQNELFFRAPIAEELSIANGDARFIFRSYNRAIAGDELCDVIPPDDLVVTENYEADSGTVQITTTIVDDDNDGILSEDEYGPGGINNPKDSDEDGIPDYIDQDDDNDNILTKNELLDDLNEDGDDDPLTNPLDTDDDGKPNYLDDDDDGDGVPTRLEDTTDNLNPRSFGNQVVNVLGEDVYRYLSNEPNAVEEFEDQGFIYNYYTRSVSTYFEVLNAGLEIINSTYIEFGTYESSFEINNVPEAD